MKKEFIKRQDQNLLLPNDPKMLTHYLLEQVKNYILISQNKKETMDLREEEVLMDLVSHILNFFSNMEKKTSTQKYKKDKIDLNYLITIILFFSASYVFEEEKRSSAKELFSKEELANILIEFLNYLTKANNYERTFTIMDLLKEYHDQKYKEKMIQLKSFLSKTSIYYKMLDAEIPVDDIIRKLFKEEGLDHISKYGTCYYTKEKRESVGAAEIEMPKEESERILNELDAIAYAYAKLQPRKNELAKSKSKLIYTRIKLMKKKDHK